MYRAMQAASALAIAVLIPASGIADSIRLTNGDIISGRIVSLDDSRLTLVSENFGEMQVPRDKIELIGLGEKSAELVSRPTAPVPEKRAEPAEQTSSFLPSLQNPQVQQQLNSVLQEVLGAGGSGDMQQNLRDTSRQLRDLQKDLGPGSSADALDGYIKMFELFGGGGSSTDNSDSPGQSQP